MKDGTLLVVDDDIDVRDTITDSLSEIDVNIVTKDNGLEALNYIKSNEIAAMLSDINMPLMNGIELLTEIRKMGLDTPVVILSAHGDKNNTLTALRNGVFALLNKPFRIDVLESVIKRAVLLGLEMNKIDKTFRERMKDKGISFEEMNKILKAKKLVLFLKAKAEMEETIWK